ncbi:type II secretion system protein M [Christensenellaceae bacterium OttesenSCG-928-L17]|nr:type II secretion system protein M [Christensenellaceae bacterium OttesenSCG-928-L17]
MNKLSAREQILLFVLGMVVLIAGSFQLLVVPGLDRIATAEQELEAMHSEKLDYMMTIEEAAAYEVTYADNVKEIEEGKSKLLPVMRSEELEGLMTDTFLLYNLTPQSVVVNMDPAAGTDNSSEFTYYSVNAIVYGKYSEFLDLIDEFNGSASYVVKNYSYKRNVSDNYLSWRFGLTAQEDLDPLLFERQDWLYATITFSMDVYVYDEARMVGQSMIIGPMIEEG